MRSTRETICAIAFLILDAIVSTSAFSSNPDDTSVHFEDLIFWNGDFGTTIEETIPSEFKKCADAELQQSGLCLEWNPKPEVRLQAYQILNDTTGINCTVVNWEALDCTVDTFEDCFDLTDAHWYGGTVVRKMYWPIEGLSHNTTAYVPGNVAGVPPGYGGVLERYWVNSNGMAVQIDWGVPLWVSINQTGDQKLCLRAQYRDSPYYNYDDSPVNLTYTVCRGNDVRHVHDYMAETYLAKPTDIPDERLFRYPIWSTWAQYRKNITQDSVLDFANAILENGFTNAQLEIDDKWEVNYGDFEFDLDKFPDPKGMVETLASMGFRTTLWVHTFVSLNSAAMKEGMRRLAFVNDPSGRLPGLTAWWDETSAMVVDFTSDRAFEWHMDRLRALQVNYNISTFKFDAGETNWLPNCYRLSPINERNPSRYTTKYVEMAYAMDTVTRHQEVRVGAQTQHVPIFLRMFDKDSRWGYSNGIETLIPHALNVGIIGYPFVLPDMVGGNGYVVFPDKELYIRWVEANALLPSIQYSIVPWQFDDEVIEITRNMTELHESFAQKMIDLARESTVTGAPIIRPLWWIAPTDPVALTIDSEFLVGDDLLVAPVVKENARSRDIYLPAGSWQDELRHDVKPGGQWFLNYTVELNEVAYFTRIATA